MRCDNSSLVYFSSHPNDAISAAPLKGKNRLGPFFGMHQRFKVTEMTVREAL